MREMRSEFSRPPRKPPDKGVPTLSLLSRNFGRPHRVSAIEYNLWQVCFLSTHNYKLQAYIWPDLQSVRPILTVLDTGVGPKVICAGL